MSEFRRDLIEKETELRNKLTKIKSLTIAKLEQEKRALVPKLRIIEDEDTKINTEQDKLKLPINSGDALTDLRQKRTNDKRISVLEQSKQKNEKRKAEINNEISIIESYIANPIKNNLYHNFYSEKFTKLPISALIIKADTREMLL